MKKKLLLLSMLVFLAALCLSGCGSGLKDGYFTAEMSEFSHGWKEYLRIQVKHGTVVSAEFNAKNESGFIKAWDNAYMKNMGGGPGDIPKPLYKGVCPAADRAAGRYQGGCCQRCQPFGE